MTDPTKEAERLAEEYCYPEPEYSMPMAVEIGNAYKSGFLKAWHLARASAFKEMWAQLNLSSYIGVAHESDVAWKKYEEERAKAEALK